MPKIATEPLLKVTLNLYQADVEWYRERYGQGWSEVMRNDIRQVVNKRDPILDFQRRYGDE